MPFIRGRRGERGRQVWRADCRHCQVIDAYQQALSTWWARRWSNEDCMSRLAGTADSNVVHMQLEDEEYRELFPMPRFKDYLVQMAQEWRDPDEGATVDDYDERDDWGTGHWPAA